jgi:hypothetical protein
MSVLELDEGVLWQRALAELGPSGLGRPERVVPEPVCVGPVSVKPARKVAKGVLGLLWRVLRPGAPGAVVYAPNNHGHIYIDLTTQGKGTE